MSLAFFGHTHCQALFSDPEAATPELIGDGQWHVPVESRCAITLGSVGQSRDPEVEKGTATWAVWDSGERRLTWKQTRFSDEESRQGLDEARLPHYGS